MEYEKTILSYIAGIIDGEGCITMRTDHPSECVMIRMKDCEALFLIKEQFGGSLTKSYNKLYNDYTFQYLIANLQANNLLKEVYPYLIIKKKNAELCFELRKIIDNFKQGTIGNKKKNELSENIRKQVRLLNQRTKRVILKK